jgi:hypothetical protein
MSRIPEIAPPPCHGFRKREVRKALKTLGEVGSVSEHSATRLGGVLESRVRRLGAGLERLVKGVNRKGAERDQ